MNSQKNLKAGLYLVATPIGNMGDITLRALDVLRGVDMVLCEDTRTSGKLLKAHEIDTRMMAYHDHSSDAAREQIVARLKGGETLALISDAGMPLISDPGYKLVQACRDNDIYLTSIPGANAALMGLQLSGLPSDKFTFLGFAPNKQVGRRALLDAWKASPATLIFYEGASRVLKMLGDIDHVMGDRHVSVARELTKMYEETVSGTATEIARHFEAKGATKGEFVIMIAPQDKIVYSEEEVCALLQDALKTQKVKAAAAQVSAQTGWKKSDVYNLALTLK